MYREILEKEFLKRVKANNAYSMRAFSRDINISSSFLTGILKHKKNLSEIKATEVAQKLKLSSIDKTVFCLSAVAESARKADIRENANKELNTVLEENRLKKVMSLKEFKEISDWVFTATLALFQTYNFKGTAQDLAGRLEIDILKSTKILLRLQELGYIEKKGRSYVSNILSCTTPSDISSEDIQKYHKKMIAKASEALEHPVSTREFSSLTLACNKDSFNEARDFIRAFQTKFTQKFGRLDKKNSIYQMSLQFFRIDKEN